jgi:hypothetical protein
MRQTKRVSVLPKKARNGERQDHERHRGLEVDQCQHELLHPATKMRGKEAEHDTDRGGNQGAGEGDHEADPDRGDQA